LVSISPGTAVIGKPHDIKGESITGFVILREGVAPSDELREELRRHVRTELGPIARPDEVLFVSDLICQRPEAERSCAES